MYRNLNFLRKSVRLLQSSQRLAPATQCVSHFLRVSGKNFSDDASAPQVPDLTKETPKSEAASGKETKLPTVRTALTPSLAPIDIDPWRYDDDTGELGWTLGSGFGIDIGAEFDDRPDDEDLVIPENRTGVYKFRGIKIELPQSMLGKGTYRYRRDKEDEDLPDDIRICCYDKEPPS